jgi:hypothetical protein
MSSCYSWKVARSVATSVGRIVSAREVEMLSFEGSVDTLARRLLPLEGGVPGTVGVVVKCPNLDNNCRCERFQYQNSLGHLTHHCWGNKGTNRYVLEEGQRIFKKWRPSAHSILEAPSPLFIESKGASSLKSASTSGGGIARIKPKGSFSHLPHSQGLT